MSAPIGNEVVELAAVVVGLHITDKVQTPLSTVMLVDLVWPGNNPDKPEEIQLHRFRCLPAIKEMSIWNIDGNFDRVSALEMLMLALHDREKYNVETTSTHKDLAQDDFFKRNYRRNG